jgi:hypothetical protein
LYLQAKAKRSSAQRRASKPRGKRTRVSAVSRAKVAVSSSKLLTYPGMAQTNRSIGVGDLVQFMAKSRQPPSAAVAPEPSAHER